MTIAFEISPVSNFADFAFMFFFSFQKLRGAQFMRFSHDFVFVRTILDSVI